MRKRQILFIGDSHTHAVQTALQKTTFTLPNTEIQAHRLTKIKNGKLIGSVHLQDLLLLCRDLTPDDMIISLIGGNQHSAFGLVQPDRPFSFADANGSLSAQAGLTVLPRATVKAHFTRGLEGNDLPRIADIAASGPQRTIHLSSPPPKEDEAHILKKFETDFARKGLAEKGLSPAGLRQQIWALQNEVLAELLQDHGVRLIPPPAGTMTETGFLDPMYYAQDATHANWEYGQKILESLEGLLATSPRES